MVHSDSGGEDGFCWRLSNNGKFFVKTVYNASIPNQTSDPNGTWKIIWKPQLPKPPQRWKKLNVYGGLNVVIPSAGAGGALRNENGDWEDGFIGLVPKR